MTHDDVVHAAVANSTLVKQRRKANWQRGTEEGLLLKLMKDKHPDWTPDQCLRSLKYLVASKRTIICPQFTRDGFERREIGAATSDSGQERAKYNAVNNQKRTDDNLAERVQALQQFHDANPDADWEGLNAMSLCSPAKFKKHISNEYMPKVYEMVFVELGVSPGLAQQASKVTVQDWSPGYKLELRLEIERLRKCVYTGMTQQVGETCSLQCCSVVMCIVAVLLCCCVVLTPTHADRRWRTSI